MAESLLTVDALPTTLQEVQVDNTAPVTQIGSHWLYRDDIRLDAGYYNSDIVQAYQSLESSGLVLKKLGDVTERIFIPPRFKRIYVGQEHGVPFLQGSHLVHFRPADLKYLSKSAHKNLKRWIIEAGWVLVTCSGTIGRVAIALQQWDGWAASQHILRVVPQRNSPCPPGYIYSWLASPLGQVQFNGIYGAVVDEITAEHVENILIPVPETREQQAIVNSINELAVQSVATKELALEQDALAIGKMDQLVQPFGVDTEVGH